MTTIGRTHVQVFTGHHEFTYDHVFGGPDGAEPDQLYPKCVAPLVDGLFRGYNATVFAYGQTGGVEGQRELETWQHATGA